jgi:hypothetical protein
MCVCRTAPGIPQGVAMSQERRTDGPEWPAQIEAAQRITTCTINGQLFDRIRYGDDLGMFARVASWMMFLFHRGRFLPRHDCGVLKDQYHVVQMCDMERCPRCGGQVISCDC